MTRVTWATGALVASALVFLPESLSPWILPKLALAAIGCLLAATVPSNGSLPRWFWAFVGGGALLLVVGALAGSAPVAQLLGRYPRYEGAVAIVVYVAAAWAGARLWGPLIEQVRGRATMRSLAVASVVLGAVSVLQALGLELWSTALDRPGALLGNATDQGIVGAMFALLLWPAVAREWRREPAGLAPRSRSASHRGTLPPAFPWLVLWGLVAGIATVAISGSRAGLLALLVGLLVVVVLELARTTSRSARRVALSVAGATAGLAVLAVVLAPSTLNRILGTSPLSSATIDDRLLMYGDALELLAANPLTGVGPSGFVDAVPDVQGPEWFAVVTPGAVLDSPHNWFLQAAMAGGLPLLVVAVAFAALAAVVGLRRWRHAVVTGSERADFLAGAGAALVAFGVALATHFTIAGTAVLAAALLGAVLARPLTSAPGSPLVGGMRGGALALLAGVLVVGAVADYPMAAGVSSASRGDITAAQRWFDVAGALRPWDADIPNIAAQAFARSADSGLVAAAAPAEADAREALGRTPDSLEGALALVAALQASGGDDQDLVAQLLARFPSHPDVLVRAAASRFADGDLAAARDLLDGAVEVQPDNVAAWTAMARLAETLDDATLAARAAAELERLAAGRD